MTFLEGLYLLIFGPLELLFESIYSISSYIFGKVGEGNPGAAIIVLSLYVNFLALPFYNRADAIQKEERERERRMAPDVEHIKKTFKAGERYMILQAYYRVNGYSPLCALRSSLPLLLEIPFFIAAYHFLSNLPALHGAQFGILKNLGKPDQLLLIGSLRINLLPIFMTLINILSSCIYAKDLSRKEKIQLYGVAAVFLAFLYNSPSGLVFYWMLNNIFSLCKNLISFAKDRKSEVCAVLSVLGVLLFIVAFAVCKEPDLKTFLIIVFGFACQIPILKTILGKKDSPEPMLNGECFSKTAEVHHEKNNKSSFILGCLFLAVLTGLLIPSSVIRSSPGEFIVLAEYQSPVLYVFSAFLLAVGTFILWLGLFYYLSDNKTKNFMNGAVWILSVAAIVNYMLFGTNFDNLSAELKYDHDFAFSMKDYFINADVLVLIGVVMFRIWRKRPVIIRMAYPVLIAAVLVMSVHNIAGITTQIPRIKTQLKQENGKKATFALSRKGKNVIVLLLDRAISSYVPYLFQERPELARPWEGFTWYPNTLSYGTRTNTGSPALLGGYEYTPEEINKRSKEALVEKQNEALKVMPVLFRNAGYEVTVCDPPYAGYSWIPDLSIYDEYKNIRTFHAVNGEFGDQSDVMGIKQQVWKRNLFYYSIMKISPLFVQPGLYQDGSYSNPYMKDSVFRIVQKMLSSSVSVGIQKAFTDSYFALRSLPDMMKTTDEKKNTFLMMYNDTPHNVSMLQEPQYEPAMFVNNIEYDQKNISRFTVNGRMMLADTAYKMSHYQSNMAAFILLGKWFDYLREQGVYDNTRIIIVADHGWPLEQFKDMMFGKKENTVYNPEDVMAYNPLLMVKDFDSRKFTIDKRFMTNADTPLLSMDRLIKKPVNPFTKKPITNDAKYANEQHVFYTDFWGVEYNRGNTFLPGLWYALKNQNIFDMKNWRKLGEY